MGLSYDQLLNLFPDKPRKKAGAGVLVLCPAHNDTNPSCWITPAKGGNFIANINCQAGCKSKDILNALGLSWAKLRRNDNNPKSEKGRIVKIYQYTKMISVTIVVMGFIYSLQ